MVQLVCPCLNVRIHVKGPSVQLQDSCALNLSEDALSDNFFSSQVYDVLLDLGGVTLAQKKLCTNRCVDGWFITRCMGCELDVYAKYQDDSDRVLVSCSIEKDPSRITALMESENYSSLFKLLLPEVNDNFMQNNIGPKFISHKSVGPALKRINQQVSAYLKEEEKAMEDRIRIFTEQQQARYGVLQQKVHKHKQAMVYLLLKMCRDNDTSEKKVFQYPSPSSPTTSNQNSSDDSCSSSEFNNELTKSEDFPMKTIEQVQPAPVPPKHSFQRMHSVNNPPCTKSKDNLQSRHISAFEVDDVFHMEGFETGDMDPPFFHSDDETDGSSTEDNVPSKEVGSSNKNVYAGSLPISVPAWSTYSRVSINEEEEEHIVRHKDPEQLAASFRALAEGASVHDGTEIFGDLPRRRLNTGDLVKSRPI